MKYTLLAKTLEAQYLAEWTPATPARIAKMKALNTSPDVIEATINAVAHLNPDQECIVYLVAKLDAADAKEKASIRYQLKNYYHFTFSK